MATKKKAAKPAAKKAAKKVAKKAPVKRGKFSGTYSDKLTKNWNPKPGTVGEAVEKYLKKGKTTKEIAEITGFKFNSVMARVSDYRRIHGLASTGKVYNSKGELVQKETKAKPVAAKKVAKKIDPAKATKTASVKKAEKKKPVTGKKKVATKKAMGISSAIPDDAVEFEPIDPVFADTDPVEEDEDNTPIM